MGGWDISEIVECFSSSSPGMFQWLDRVESDSEMEASSPKAAQLVQLVGYREAEVRFQPTRLGRHLCVGKKGET